MWKLAGKDLHSRLLLGTAAYSSLSSMEDAIRASGTEVITLSIKRQAPEGKGGEVFWQAVKKLGCHLLPNTAGCRDAKSAVTTAELARELFNTAWIKLEVIGDDYNLQPDPFELIKAAKILLDEGFEVFPYCTDDLVLCQKLVDMGCKILMPWAAPIGSGKGLLNPYALETLRIRFPDITLIVDAGIGKPSHAIQAMELGFDGVLLNTAVAQATHPVMMASAFRHAVMAGQQAFAAGTMPERNVAHPSTSLIDTPFWHQEKKKTKTLFKPCKTGLYPVVDSSDWIEKLCAEGVKCIQLRIKNSSEAVLEKEIKKSLEFTRKHQALLFVNDYWELAIRLGVDGVHLGQEDLDSADIERIYQAGLYLGISTHCEYEVDRAQALQPSYMAIGPIYPTTSKVMPFDPQGIEKLKKWRQKLDYPLIAIGGINLENLPDVLECGVDGIAVISAIIKAPDPLMVMREFLERI